MRANALDSREGAFGTSQAKLAAREGELATKASAVAEQEKTRKVGSLTPKTTAYPSLQKCCLICTSTA